MGWTFIVIFAHWVAAILLAGYCLFWVVMTAATRREFSGSQAGDLLERARTATWPIPGLEPSLAVIGWLLLAFAGASGMLALALQAPPDGIISMLGSSRALLGKIVLFAVLPLAMYRLGRSNLLVAVSGLAIVLAIVAASVHIVR